ncbi:hypothetical protein pEaSNUABM11_00119 [Erwinia phage pEa_SNUABM_11]|nr:hypothetical protein pEaSNUABM11_00119 [Erwinia phage pEa_SNUABM_11]
MSIFRTVPHHDGQRFTFGIKRYAPLHRPGWRTVRALGQFWRLPPGLSQYLTDEDVQRLMTTCDDRQRASFMEVCQVPSLRKTCDATAQGIYWTGQKAFQVGMQEQTVTVTPFRLEGETVFTGIRITAGDYDYLLATDKDVSMATFYKYLLFYSHHISKRSLTTDGYDFQFGRLPYSRDKRLEKCSIESLSATPNH